jgi:hypothetical protein
MNLETTEADRIIFHFNKAHLSDPTIPMWTIKHKGQTYYIDHLTVEPGIGFRTKETPESQHTKGSLQFKGRLKIWEHDNQTEALIY